MGWSEVWGLQVWGLEVEPAGVEAFADGVFPGAGGGWWPAVGGGGVGARGASGVTAAVGEGEAVGADGGPDLGRRPFLATGQQIAVLADRDDAREEPGAAGQAGDQVHGLAVTPLHEGPRPFQAIGLGVNENQVCLYALGIGDWEVFLLAGRYTLLEQTALETLFPACQAAGTTIICGGPFNSGILVGRNMWNYAKAPAEVVEKARALGVVADEFSIPLAAAALQFPLASPTVTSVIPGPRDAGELRQILDWFETTIPVDFWSALKSKGLLDDAAPVPG